MSDILFNCSDCDAPLAVDGDMAGTVMKCPGCGKGIGVPKPDVEFKCAKCGHAHQAPEWATGKPFTCVGCEAELHIPAPGFAAQDAVGARRIHRFATPPREPATVAPQAQFPPVGHSLRANRVREGGEFPIDKQTVKVAVYALIGIVVVAVFGNPLKWEVWKHLRKGGEEAKTQVTNKVASAVAPPKPAPVTNVAPPKVVVVRTNQFWKAALTNLSTLAGNPKAPGGIGRLETDVARLWDKDRDAAVPLAVAYALLRLDVEQDAGGCLWMESHMPGTDAAKRCAKANFYSPCQTCKQTGETRNSCAQCKDGKCRTCDGKGKEKRVEQAPRRLTPVQLGGGGRAKKLGEAPAPKVEAPVETWVTCTACEGAKKCAACGGKGFTVKPCYACRGAKRVYNPAAATRHREDAVAAALKVASARLLSEDEPPPPLDPNAFLASFGSNSAADLKRLQEVLKGNEVSLWDAIMFYSTSTPDDAVSVDPDMADVLVETTVPRARATSLDKASLGRLLESKGLLLKDARLPNGTNVLFVSSPAACAYLAACTQARAKQYDEALRTLATTKHEDSWMEEQAAGLAKALEAMTKDWRTLSALCAETKMAAANYSRALKQAEAIRNAPVMESGASIKLGDNREINKRGAANRVAAARERLLKARMSFDELLKRTNESHGLVMERLTCGCWPVSLSTEAAALIEYLMATDSLVQDAAKVIQETGVTAGKPLLNDQALEQPAFLRSLEATVRKAMDDSVRSAKDAEAREGADRLEKLVWAVAFDRCNASAKVALGHAEFLDRRRSLQETVLSGDKAEVVARFGRMLRERQKRSSDAAFVHVNEGGVPRSVDVPATVGRVNGLAVTSDGWGKAFPVSIHIKSVVPQCLLVTEEVRGWHGNSVRRVETWTQPFPISFGDYGEKDMWMVISAIEAWKWLLYRHVDGSTNKQCGLHIEFNSLVEGKGGDSAGAAFGVAAWSAWSRTPILQNVAMTGSIRSDGTVEAVGAVPMKVGGALRSEGIETVIVPKANVFDLAGMTFEDLCTIAVVTTDGMDTYVAYATGTGEAAKAIPPLRKAQMLAFLGRRKEAWDILLPLVARHPELYSARRLAEVLITYDPTLAEGGAK